MHFTDLAYRAIQPGLFRCEAETAHRLTMTGLAAYARVARPKPRPPVCRVLGIDFPSRVGLAAGMDKDGTALGAWAALGFGFVEVGTVTALPQPGNDRPRLFRLRADNSLINRLGFNNNGSAALAERLRALGKLPIPLGISIGKSKVTPLAESTEDYLTSLRRVHEFADYIAINVSSPNTPGLRSLQNAAALAELTTALVATSAELSADQQRGPVPIAVKVSPDMTATALAELVDVCLTTGVAGIIATNTTLDRSGVTSPQPVGGLAGGLSGRLLTDRACAVIETIAAQAGDRLPIIGVGGISSAADGQRFINAGASLVQVYSGLVYRGPQLIRELSHALDGSAGE
jgi:dihydroorotate dehydrogenase